MLSVLPFLLMAALVIVGFLWYTGRIALNFEPLTTYANPMLGVSFRYPNSWKPDFRYGTVGDLSGRYQGDNGFFGLDAMYSTNDIASATDELIHHKLQPYGANPTIVELTADDQPARIIIPSKDQAADPKQVGLIVKYPQPMRISGNTYNYLLVVGDIGHIKMFADTLHFQP